MFTVSSGYMHGRVERFDSFDEALTVYAQRLGARDGASLLGETDYDCDQDGYYMCDDGLTEEQRDRIEEVN